MMAEIYMLRLEAAARAAKEAAAHRLAVRADYAAGRESVLARKAAPATAPRKKPRTSRTEYSS